MAAKKLVDAVLTEHIGETLTLELAAKLSAQLVESILMSRDVIGLPEKAGESTNIEAKESKKGKKIIMAKGPDEKKEPKPDVPYVPELAEELKPLPPRAKAIESRPFEGFDPSRDPEDQPDTMPFTIRRGKKG